MRPPCACAVVITQHQGCLGVVFALTILVDFPGPRTSQTMSRQAHIGAAQFELRKDHRHTASNGLALSGNRLGREVQLFVGASRFPGNQMAAMQHHRGFGTARRLNFQGRLAQHVDQWGQGITHGRHCRRKAGFRPPAGPSMSAPGRLNGCRSLPWQSTHRAWPSTPCRTRRRGPTPGVRSTSARSMG